MAEERYEPANQRRLAGSQVIYKIGCHDPKLYQWLLSNPIVTEDQPRFMHIRLPGHPPQLWVMIDKASELE